MRYQSERPKRRFLAGCAVLCQALDAIVQVNIFVPQRMNISNAPSAIIASVALILMRSAQNHLEDQPARDATLTGTRGTVKFKP